MERRLPTVRLWYARFALPLSVILISGLAGVALDLDHVLVLLAKGLWRRPCRPRNIPQHTTKHQFVNAGA